MSDEGSIFSSKDKRLILVTAKSVIIASIVITSFYAINFVEPYNLSSINIPPMAVSSLVTIFALVISFISLSYNLDQRIPKSLSRKYIIEGDFLWEYIGIQLGLIFTLCVLIITSIYSQKWDYTFVSALMLSLVSNIVFIRKYTKRASKKGLYDKIIEDAEFPIPERIEFMEKFREDTRYSTHSAGHDFFAYRKDDELDQNGIYSDINNEGIIKIDSSNLNSIEASYEKVYSIDIPYHNSIVGGRFDESKLSVTVDGNSQEYLDELKSAVEVKGFEEVSWLSDWLMLVRHSLDNEIHDVDRDFELLKESLIDDARKNPNILNLVQRVLVKELVTDNVERNQIIMRECISLMYENSDALSDNPEITAVQIKTLNVLMSSFLLKMGSNYSSDYLNSVLYISEQLKFDFRKNFEEETYIKNYEKAIESAINISQNIIMLTLRRFHLDEDLFEKYLTRQINDFASLLETYDESEDHYFSRMNFYLEEDETKADLSKHQKENLEKKTETVQKLLKKRDQKLIEIALSILVKVEKGDIPTKMKNTGFEILENLNLSKCEFKSYRARRKVFNPDNKVTTIENNDYKLLSQYLVWKQFNQGEIPNLAHEQEEKIEKDLKDLEYSECSLIDISETDFEETCEEILHWFNL